MSEITCVWSDRKRTIFGLGTIHCCSADKSTPEFDIKNIKKVNEVKELLSDMIEKERDRKRISGRRVYGFMMKTRMI